jgi:iron complex outermembrane receptor protein
MTRTTRHTTSQPGETYVTIADAVRTGHRPLPHQTALAHALGRYARASAYGMLIVGSAAAPVITLAQNLAPERRADLEEVTVVRSRNRLEPLKDVPLSISALSALELDRESIVNIDDFARRVTNLTFNSGNPRQSSLSIRGVGKQAQTDAQDPSVGIIVDGVNYAYNAMSFYDFTDIEAIEVTRGPQGTLLGKNTTLGVLNIITKRPSFEPDANISVQFGENDALFVRGAGGGAVIDDVLAWRASFYSDRRQGPYINVNDNGNRSYTDRDRSGGRAQLLWTPNEDISVRFSVDVTPRNGENSNGLTFRQLPPEFYADGTPVNLGTEATTRLARRWFTQQDNYTVDGHYLGYSEPRLINNDAQEALFTSTKGGSVYVDWQLGEFTLTSITAYKDYYFDARNDEGTPFDISKNGNTTVNYDQTSQEFRISSNTTGSLDYQAGLFLFKSQNIYNAKASWGSDAGAWFANAAQYQRLDADGNGRTLLQNSLNRLFVQGTENIRNSNAAVFAQANWHIADAFTVTFGGRLTREDRKNRYVREILDNGYGAELNPVAVNGVLLPGNSLAQLQRADFTAQKYFGVAPTANPGEAYSSLGANQLAQLAAAKALRQGQIGLLNDPVDGSSYEQTQPAYLVSPSWRLTDDHTAYASFQYGEKAGIVQFTNGIANNAEAEESLNYELGLKSILLDGTLRLYTSVYHNDIKNYQQSVRVYDAYTTNLRNDGLLYYAGATGNVPRVLERGVELDGTYTGIENLSIRFNAAYSDATYRDFPNSAQPSENGYVGAAPFRDVTGEQLPGNARWTFSVGGEYSIPVFSDKELSLSLNHFHTAKYNSDNALSSYGWVPSHGVTDLGFGIGADDGSWASRLIVRNVLDTDKRAAGWNSWSPVNVPRWVGLELRASL